MIKDEVIQGEWKMVCYVHRPKLMRHYGIWIEPHSLLLRPQPASNCCSLTCLISLGYCSLCCFIFQEFLSANSSVFYGCALAVEGDIHHHHEPLISVGIRKRTGTWILKKTPNRVGISSRCGRLRSSSQLHFLDETFNWLIRWHILSSSALLATVELPLLPLPWLYNLISSQFPQFKTFCMWLWKRQWAQCPPQTWRKW